MPLSLSDAAREHPSRVAIIAAGKAHTFSGLWDMAIVRMEEIQSKIGADSRSCVALTGNTDLATVVSLYALWEMGIPALLLHPRAPDSEKQEALSRFRPAGFINGEETEPFGQPATDLPAGCACLILTSGTSGQPKAVLLSHRAFAASAQASAGRLMWFPKDRWLATLPLSHVGGLSIITRCLLARSCAVLNVRFSAEAFIRQIEENAVTQVSVVPTMLEKVFAAFPNWRAPERVRFALVGGGAARHDLARRAAIHGLKTLLSYGLTECCSQVCTQSLDRSDDDPTCGEPLDGFDVDIREGEICVKSAALMSGYYPGAPGVAIDSDGWFHTGDTGSLVEGSRLLVHGRKDDLLVTGGENVHPSEVEAALLLCPGVTDACVFGIPDPTWGQSVCAVIVASENATFDPSTTKRLLADRLAPFKIPRKYAVVDAIPLNRNGKPDRRKARAILESQLRDF